MILTDDEIDAVAGNKRLYPINFARAIEAAILTKIGEPVAWTLTKTLDEKETTCQARLWFSDPVNSAWTPLYKLPEVTK